MKPPYRKYSNVRIHEAGHSFASKLEASVFQILKLMERAGEISELQCQDHVYMTLARICYIPDFCYINKEGNKVWAEAKGIELPEWKLKKRLWLFYGPGQLDIYMGNWRSPRLVETLIPKVL